MSTQNVTIEDSIVTGYQKEDAHLVIPEGVIEIGEGVFKDCLWLKSVTIESSVFRTIGDNAFKGCKNLQSISIKTLRGAIGEYAFDHCEQLERISIPSGAMEIRKCAFNSCGNLSEIGIPSTVMVIADTAFEKSLCKKMLILCAPNTEAARFADKKLIPHRQDTYKVRNALETARKARMVLETRTFNVFGQKIIAPNSLSLYVDIPKHYSQRKNSFFNSFLKHLPVNASEKIDGRQAVKDMDALIQETILRLEKQGIFINQTQIDSEILAAYSNIATVIKSTHDFRKELWNIGNANLENYKDLLLQEAESRVTGLSYGVIGDSLTMAAYAIDDFRTRQRQRKNAYSEARQQINTFASQTDAEINTTYMHFYEDTAKPALRIGTDALIDSLCSAELRLLKEYGLLEDIADDEYDAKLSAEIIRRANSKDKEYAVGLAIKTFPLNWEAYWVAAMNGLVTDELVDLFVFMGIENQKILFDFLHSNNVTTKKLIDLYERNPESDSYREALDDRCHLIKMEIASLLDKKFRETSVTEIQKKVDSIVDAETWRKLNGFMPLVDKGTLQKINQTIERIRTEEGYKSLGQYIAEFHASQANVQPSVSEEESKRREAANLRALQSIKAAAEEERKKREAARLRALQSIKEAEEEEQRRKEEEQKRKEEEQRRKEEEQRRREVEELAAKRVRYDQLVEQIAIKKRIISENKGWFGASAKMRKITREQLLEIQAKLEREFPEGKP